MSKSLDVWTAWRKITKNHQSRWREHVYAQKNKRKYIKSGYTIKRKCSTKKWRRCIKKKNFVLYKWYSQSRLKKESRSLYTGLYTKCILSFYGSTLSQAIFTRFASNDVNNFVQLFGSFLVVFTWNGDIFNFIVVFRFPWENFNIFFSLWKQSDTIITA